MNADCACELEPHPHPVRRKIPGDIVTALWHVDSRPIPAELEPDYRAETYTGPKPTFFPPLADRLDEVMRQRLTDMYGSI